MPLVTIPTSSGPNVRIRCELHTPWTQLPDGPPARGGGDGNGNSGATAHDLASGYQPPAPASATSQPTHFGSPAEASEMQSRSTFSAGKAAQYSTSAAAAAPSNGQAPPPQQQQQQQREMRQRQQQPRVNDPGRQKLLIVASLGVEGGSGWFTHVAQHFAALRDSATGQPAADVVTFDNRRRFSTDGRAPPSEGMSGYRTEAMAHDAVALMDALGWRQAHLVGMSLGAMVAAKAAAAAPQRVASLTLLGYTLNGWQMAASLVTNPQQLFKVLVGSHRSKVKATLPFYFTRRFLDAEAPRLQQAQRQQEAAAAHGLAAGRQAGSSSDDGTGSRAASGTAGAEDGSAGSSGSGSGGAHAASALDVPVAESPAQRALLERRHRDSHAAGTAPAMTIQDAILAQQELPEGSAAPQPARSGSGAAPPGGNAGAGNAAGNAGGSGDNRAGSGNAAAAAGRSRRRRPVPSGESQLHFAALADAGSADLDSHPEQLPDTGLKGHSMACLLHWLNKPERRTIAHAAFPTTLLVGRHDPVAPPRWVQKAATSLRATLTITEASHAGLTVESCPELLSGLELHMFGRTLGGAGVWRACRDAAIEDAISNPHLIKR